MENIKLINLLNEAKPNSELNDAKIKLRDKVKELNSKIRKTTSDIIKSYLKNGDKDAISDLNAICAELDKINL